MKYKIYISWADVHIYTLIGFFEYRIIDIDKLYTFILTGFNTNH